jgi:protein TonB
MSHAVRFADPLPLDEPWRLAWIAPLAVFFWMGLLLIFALMLKETAAPPPENNPIEARIIEIPPTAGLQSSPPRAPVAPSKPVPKRSVPPHPHVSRPRPIAPVAPPSITGTAKSEASPASTPASNDTGAEQNEANLGGTDSTGARAIYAPVPEIPDELRENALNAVAVAHFKIDPEGKVEVSLVQPTENPRLNELLLDTLKQWRFAPAIKGGVAMQSEFDIRIPITVQ